MSFKLQMSDLVEMSASLQERDIASQGRSEPQPVGQPTEDIELGWHGVAAGLTRILMGYSLILSQVLLAVALVFYLLSQIPHTSAEAAKVARSAPAILWTSYAGLGLIALLSLFSFWMILSGKCRCAIDAPELGGARWLMFSCIVCMASGTVLSVCFSIFGTSTSKEVVAAKTKEEMLRNLKPPALPEVIGAGLNATATILFVLFLRAVGRRFSNSALTRMTEIYLLCFAIVAGVTVQGVYLTKNQFGDVGLLIILGLGWLVLSLFFVSLIIVTRLSLGAELSRPRNTMR